MIACIALLAGGISTGKAQFHYLASACLPILDARLYAAESCSNWFSVLSDRQNAGSDILPDGTDRRLSATFFLR